MQKMLAEFWINNLTFSILSSLKLNFSTTVFSTTWLCTWYLGHILVAIEKLLILHIVVAFMLLEIAKQLLSNS